MANHIKLGVDVGNYDTKSQHTTTASSYQKQNISNALDEESIFYNGAYYTPTLARNNQQLDKTEDDYCLIISLFAIAKEIIYTLRKENPNITSAELQSEISKITEFSLGIGLPAGHLSALANKTIGLYQDKMQKGISFTYRYVNQTYEFNLKMIKCSAYPQDYIAVAYNKDLTIPSSFTDYYIVGIGGGTVDIIPVHNGRPLPERCISLDLGTTIMYAEIIKAIQHETGRTMEYNAVEDVLLGRNTIIDETRKNRIKELAAIYTDKLVDELIHRGLKLSDYPCVFIGGGALMMKAGLKKNDKIIKQEYVEDVHANAKYYAEFV